MDEYYKNFIANIILLVTISAITCFLLNLKKWKSNKSAPLPPGPRGFPIIGYLPFLGTHLHKTFTELAQVYGPIYKIWLGSKLCIVISSPSLVKEIVRDQDTTFASRDAPIAAQISSFGCNDIAWCPYGPDWKKMRKVFVSQMMSNSSLEASYSLRKREVRNVVRSVYKRCGESVDIGELSILASMNVIQNFLWGSTLPVEEGTDLGKKFRGLFAELMCLLGAPNVSDIFPVLAMFDLQGIAQRSKEVSLGFETMIDKAIERHKNMVRHGEGKKDFLHILLELQESDDPATSFTTHQLKAVVQDVILGGVDTTITMVEWTMAELMQNPEVMKKVQEELVEVVGANDFVEEIHLPRLRYLDAVVKESSRLHPALPFLIPRCPSNTTTIGGYTIPEGSRVMVNVWALHRDPQLWDNPLEFKPERFLNDSEKLDYMGNNFKYMPFGSGRRVCAGIPLAERMLMFILASLLYSFEWELPNGLEVDLADKFGIVIKKMKPLVVVPKAKWSNLELYE